MRWRIRTVFVLVALAAAPGLGAPGLPAQPPSGRALLEGTVRDSATRTVTRAQVCVTLPSGPTSQWYVCSPVDTSSGAYRLDSLPTGRWRIDVNCATVRLFATHGLQSDSIAVADSAPVRRDWIVGIDGCDPRPLRRVEGTFRGYYTPGFESSAFIPCATDAWFVPSDSLRTTPYDERRAWAWLQQSSLPEAYEWPPAPKDDFGNPTYYVQWSGTVVGPGHYGHMGISPFELQVDSVHVLRAPRRGDCPAIR